MPAVTACNCHPSSLQTQPWFAAVYGMADPTQITNIRLRSFDDECRAVVRENMEKRGIQVHLQTNPTK